MATSVGNTPSGLARPASPRSSHPLPSDFLGTFARRARKFPDQPRNSQAKVSLGKGTALVRVAAMSDDEDGSENEEC